jgi:hypothetical protein
VTSYTITITPDDSSATTTTLRLDTSDSEVKLTDLHLHAGNGLATGALPAIDYGLLLRAITPATPNPVLTAPTPAREIGATPAPHAEPVAAQQPDAPSKQRTAGRTTARRTSKATTARRTSKATPAVAEPATKPGTRRAGTAGKKSTPSGASAGRTKKTAKAARVAPAKKGTRAAAANGRAYRRMPDDFATVYQQAGTAAAVADHYDVPRHTAHGWIRRLREQGATTTAS